VERKDFLECNIALQQTFRCILIFKNFDNKLLRWIFQPAIEKGEKIEQRWSYRVICIITDFRTFLM
jgi:hypothetical protein